MRGLSLYRHHRFLPASLLGPLAEHVASAPGDPAAVQAAQGGPLQVAGEVRRALEIDLTTPLHDAVLNRLEAVRDELTAHFDVALEPCDAVAALRYPPGAFYRTHRDAATHEDALDLHRRAVSVVIFLNSGAPAPGAAFTGGQLRFHEGPGTETWPCDIVPLAGTLVAFPSAWLHEVRPVAQGLRVALAAWFLRDG